MADVFGCGVDYLCVRAGSLTNRNFSAATGRNGVDSRPFAATGLSFPIIIANEEECVMNKMQRESTRESRQPSTWQGIGVAEFRVCGAVDIQVSLRTVLDI